MPHQMTAQRFDTIVIGGGQAGLAMGYFLAQQQRDFVILDAGEQVGDTWRRRWDTLRLFTPAFHSSLPGMPFPAPGASFPSKDEVAEYLARYAARFALPVRLGQRVEWLSRHDNGYFLQAGEERYVAERVVVATGAYHAPRLPEFASQLAPQIVQLHSSAYRRPDQLPAGDALVVGAGNSGAEIAVELAATRRTYLAGRDTGYIPLRLIQNRLTLWLTDRLVTTDTRLGRQMHAMSQRRGDPLVRLTPRDVATAGVKRVSRVTSIADGRPQLADGQYLDVAVVVWATGYQADFDWIALPIFDAAGVPVHHRGVVDAAPGLYFLGLPFLHTPTSSHLGGVGRDARYIAAHLAAHASGSQRRPARPAAAYPRSIEPNELAGIVTKQEVL